MFEGLKCLAVPVPGADGVAAALSVSAPETAFSPTFEARALAAPKETAASIGARLAV